ncbi:MAG: hypothetical protein AAGI63_13125 [Planctomycetota bacterium]
MKTERPSRFSLLALIVFVTLIVVFCAVVRAVALNPDLLALLLPIYGIAVTMTPVFLTGFDPASRRITLGCIVSPLIYLVMAILFATICMSYRSFVIIGE